MRPELCSKRGFQEHVCSADETQHKQGYVALCLKQTSFEAVFMNTFNQLSLNQYYFNSDESVLKNNKVHRLHHIRHR
jgi:hypothetical protein